MSDGPPLRLGFIGCGRHAQAILYPSLAWTPFEFVAVAGLDAAEAEATARRFGARRAYEGHERLLEHERDLDAIAIAVGPPAYGAVLTAAIERGLPVFCEKPAAASAAEAGELAALAAARGVPVSVGYMKRFAPAYELARREVASPAFGTPRVFGGVFAMGGGIYPDDYTFLADNSVHMLDLALHFMGPVDEVASMRVEGADGRVAYAVQLRFARGAVGLLHLSTMRSWRSVNERVEITGEGSTVVVDNVTSFRAYGPDGRGTAWEPNHTVPTPDNASVALTGYVHELRHFARVARGEVAPVAGLADTRAALELVERIHVASGGALDAGTRAADW